MDERELIFASLKIMKTGNGCWPIDSVCKKANNNIDVDDYLLEDVIDFLLENELVQMCNNIDKTLNRYSLMLKSKGNKFTIEQYNELINPKKEKSEPNIHIEVHGDNNGNLSGINNGTQSSKIEHNAAPEKQNKAIIAKIMKWSLSILGGIAAVFAIIEAYNKH